MSKKKRIGTGQYILTVIMGLYAIVCFAPMVLVVIVSFSSNNSIDTKGFSFFPTEWSLDAWRYVFDFGNQLVVSYGVTIYITVVATATGLIIMSMFAYTLSRSCFMLKKHLSIMMLITMLFSGGALSSYMIKTTMYGMKDSLWAIALPAVATMNVIIMRTYIQSNITESLIESAKIDGAGEFRIFLQIVFPLMKPTLAAIGFRTAVGKWNEWQSALLFITSAKKTPLQLLLIRIEKNIDFVLNNAGELSPIEYAEMLENIPEEPGRMAILLTALGPIMIAYPYFQKYFVKGLTVGAVKG